jgi:hypothetical protein
MPLEARRPGQLRVEDNVCAKPGAGIKGPALRAIYARHCQAAGGKN